MRCLVTGGAGFIGSHLVDKLLERSYDVVALDNFRLGKKEHIAHNLDNPKFKFIELDLVNLDKVKKAFEENKFDIVFHLAANSIISGNKVTDIDLNVGTIATYNVLESMRISGVKKIVFSSTSAIYGEVTIKPTPEDYGPMLPISLYGASKLACEGLISSFCHNFKIQAWIFRFANIIGERGTHGVMVDFVKKLEENPKELEILGDGHQSKPYLEVKDCVSGILFGLDNSDDELNYFNLGTRGHTNVKKIADLIVKHMGLKEVKYNFTGGKRGWTGDVPQVELDTSKMEKLGWASRYTSDEAVEIGTKEYLANRT